MSLALIVPSKERPGNAARLIKAVNETAGDDLGVVVIAVDHCEPLLSEYQSAIPENDSGGNWDWVKLAEVKTQPQRMGPVLNALAVEYARTYDYIGFMGDDHLPRTPNWDAELVVSLDGRPGVAYGNDLAQGEKLPTACVVSSDIIRSLGYMCPPGQDHLYLDDFWKTLGASTRLVYRNDVVIEHLHPLNGKAEWDNSYRVNNDVTQYERDKTAYDRFIAQDWPGQLARLRRDLGL